MTLDSIMDELKLLEDARDKTEIAYDDSRKEYNDFCKENFGVCSGELMSIRSVVSMVEKVIDLKKTLPY